MSPDEIVAFLTAIEVTIEEQIGELSATLALVRDKKQSYRQPATAGVRLEVPWLSQLSATAGFARGDCGTALVAMLLNWRGQAVTVDQVSRATNKSVGFLLLSFNELILAALRFGLTLTYQHDLTLPQMIADLDVSKPVIVLLNYRSIPSRFDGQYHAGHYVLVVGYDDQHMIYHDPYWPKQQDGAFKVMTHAEFEAAYSAIAPGNQHARHALRVD